MSTEKPPRGGAGSERSAVACVVTFWKHLGSFANRSVRVSLWVVAYVFSHKSPREARHFGPGSLTPERGTRIVKGWDAAHRGDQIQVANGEISRSCAPSYLLLDR